MKILLATHAFYPVVGGIEEVSYILAHEFVALGHEVQVVTQTKEEGSETFPFVIHRNPGLAKLFQLVRWCDVFFHNNISLRTAWPLFLVPKSWVIAHHTWICRTDGRTSWFDLFKHFATRLALNISVSRAVAAHLRVPSEVIGNPYRNEIFTHDGATPRDRDLVFLGRLVSDKGLGRLLEALALLGERGLHPSLTIIGIGPEEQRMRALASALELNSQVKFAGLKRGAEVADLLRRHRFMVIPSAFREPFGIIALEGIACGCVPIGADGGGLGDAIGPCGLLFDRGNVTSLAEAIEKMLTTPSLREEYVKHASTHLAKHHARPVAEAYLRVLEAATNVE